MLAETNRYVAADATTFIVLRSSSQTVAKVINSPVVVTVNSDHPNKCIQEKLQIFFPDATYLERLEKDTIESLRLWH
jgi:hypothetical protein